MEAGAQVEPDWSEVVRRCLSGESPAWTELVRAHHRRVYALCYRFTGSGTDAEDLTQEVFLKIYANLTSFDTARGSPAGLDHDPDPQSAGGSFPPYPQSKNYRLARRRLG
jgi:hypothetical protein